MNPSVQKIIIMLLAIAALTYGVTIGPHIYEQQNNGDNNLPEMTYSLSVDCTAAAINVIVMDNATNPVQDANTYLKYVDFSSPTIGTGKSDKDGFVVMKLPGNVLLMRGLFIMVIEKKGFRNKEIHFDIVNCLTNTSWIPPIPPPPKPKPNTSYTQPNQTGAQQNSSANQTGGKNNSGAANSTANGNSGGFIKDFSSALAGIFGGLGSFAESIGTDSALLAIALVLLTVLIIGAIAIIWYFLKNRKKPWRRKKQEKSEEKKGKGGDGKGKIGIDGATAKDEPESSASAIE